LRRLDPAAHDAPGRQLDGPAHTRSEGVPVETVIGVALIVISALEIWFIVRTVQSNMGRTTS
jgi:hypothetical protein